MHTIPEIANPLKKFISLNSFFWGSRGSDFIKKLEINKALMKNPNVFNNAIRFKTKNLE